MTFNSLASGQPPRAALPVLTLEQFGRAAEIARLAAMHDLNELSLRAVREALRPGPPTPAVAGGATFGRTTTAVGRVVQPGQTTDDSAVSIQVEQRIEELDKLWRQHGVPAERAYETLVEVVLPDARPAEILIYPQPVRGDGEPRSVGRLLVRWAADARRIDDLKRRIAARQSQPLAELAARVLLSQLAAEAGDWQGEEECFKWIEERLKTDKLAHSAGLARHALTDAQRDDLLNPRANPGGRRFRAELAGEEFFSAHVGRVLAMAHSLPPGERYAYLKAWVLPGDDHAGFRLYGDFTPADAAPPVAAGLRPNFFGDAPVLHEATNRLHTGGTIEAPAFELVSLAAAAGGLDGLANDVERSHAESAVDQRGKLAMMVLVRVAQERDADAEKLLGDLRARLPTVDARAPEWVRWPDLTAVVAANRRPKLLGASYALALQIVLDHIQPGHQGFGDAWRRHIYDASAVAYPGTRSGTHSHLRDWAPVSHDSPSSCGLGMPPAIWVFQEGKLSHFGGRTHDGLYFRVPLHGNFEVNAKLSGWREIQVAYAGVLVGLGWSNTDYWVSHFGRQIRRTNFVPPLLGVEYEYDYRLVVEDDMYAAHVNGRRIYEQRLPTERDPWLVLSQPASHSGFARNLTITGRPTVPESLEISKLPDLTGWLTYDPELEPTDSALPQGERSAGWQKIGGEIRGGRSNRPEGSRQESVLRYHRPLLEDAELEYEFFYDPAKTVVYPALDRLVFLLGDDGIAIHWLTDSPYDRTGLSPGNVAVEAANRRGPAALPLVSGEWNRVKLALAGDRVTLWLNEIEIYGRSLEPTNQRVFGLFHYADASDARVRNVVYRGDWPRHLPAVEDQELK